MNRHPRVYLAGPGVFRRDATSYGAALKDRCRSLGLEPLWPLDNQPTATDANEIAKQIRQMNCAMIARSDAVLANISPFRGPNMDPGTAFEIGYALALLKPVWLYSESPRYWSGHARPTIFPCKMGSFSTQALCRSRISVYRKT